MTSARGRLLLIDVGGTIGEGSPRYPRPSWRIEHCGAARLLSPARTRALRRIADFDYVFASDAGSPDIDPRVWLEVAKAIYQHKTDYAGFVVTHGTDTLAWAAATLGFALWGLSGPVVVTGATRPLTSPGSDGWPNLVGSFHAAHRGVGPGVAVAFGSRILHGCRARKLASSGPVDVFESPAIPPLGRTGNIRLVPRRIHLESQPLQLDESRRFHFDPAVAFVPISPNLPETAFARLRWSRGVVVETYPSGTIPRRILPALKALAADRPVVVSVENGRLVAPDWPRYPSFLIPARDMTREAVVVKLMWALAQSADRDSLRRLMTTNLVGELSPSEPAADAHRR